GRSEVRPSRTGTIRSPRDIVVPPHGLTVNGAVRVRTLPTEHGHAALPIRATRAYQRDSSSKRPASVAVLRFDPQTRRPPPRTKVVAVDSRSLHITDSSSSHAPRFRSSWVWPRGRASPGS